MFYGEAFFGPSLTRAASLLRGGPLPGFQPSKLAFRGRPAAVLVNIRPCFFDNPFQSGTKSYPRQPEPRKVDPLNFSFSGSRPTGSGDIFEFLLTKNRGNRAAPGPFYTQTGPRSSQESGSRPQPQQAKPKPQTKPQAKPQPQFSYRTRTEPGMRMPQSGYGQRTSSTENLFDDLLNGRFPFSSRRASSSSAENRVPPRRNYHHREYQEYSQYEQSRTNQEQYRSKQSRSERRERCQYEQKVPTEQESLRAREDEALARFNLTRDTLNTNSLSKAYRVAARATHPDKVKQRGGSTAKEKDADEQMKMLNQQKQLLDDLIKRRYFNRMGPD